MRVGIITHIPEVLRQFGVEFDDVLAVTGVDGSLFAHPDNRIPFGDYTRLLDACERLTGCEHVTLLIGQQVQLARFGLLGQAVLCGATAGEGLDRFIESYNLHSTATCLDLHRDGPYSRVTFVSFEPGFINMRPLHLGAMTILINILRELFGPQWRATGVTFSFRSLADTRPLRQFFRTPLRFDCDETAISFASRWLERPLPSLDPDVRMRIEAEARRARAELMMSLPDVVRQLLRRQILGGRFSMDHVAKQLGMHRRTLDRRLRQHGQRYGDLLEAVRCELAQELLHDTDLKVQQIAQSLSYSSAANFATAFRQWSGMTPTEFRRQRKE